MDNADPKAPSIQGLESRLAGIEQLLASDPARASQDAEALSRDFPDQPMAQLFLGIALRLAGKPEAAIPVLTQLCAHHPEAPAPALQLGLVHRELGNNDKAVSAMRRAVAAKQDFADAWYALADLLTAMEDRKAADEAFGMYIRYAGSDPRLSGAGRALRENRMADAETILRSHLDVCSNDVAALCMLADIEERVGNIEESRELLVRCLDLAPSFQRARHNYAVILLRQNEKNQALEEVDRILAGAPGDPDARKLKAAILVRMLEYEKSIEICRELLVEDPKQPAVWTSLGHMLKSVGARHECIEAYRKAIELAPQFGEPYWSLLNLKNYAVEDADLKAMIAHVNSSGTSERDKLHFHFAIGKALEDRGEFEESFRHYAAGNQMRFSATGYNIQEMIDHAQQSKSALTVDFFASRERWGAEAADPIFVLGLPRSGSTLVEQILASHSAVEGTMELTDIAATAKSLNDRARVAGGNSYLDLLARLDADAYRELGEAYIKNTKIHRKQGTPFFVDKMPNNFAHIGLIHLILPNARIVDVRRHPLACGFSLFKEHFARAQGFSYDLATIGKYYRTYVELMSHFDTVLPGRVHRVVYESLISDTEGEVRRLLAYCGLPFEETCLDFHRNRRAVSTASAEQVRQPIYKNALDHWRNYEPWLGPLKAELGPLLEFYTR